MIDFTLADMVGGEPMTDTPNDLPVFYVRTSNVKDKVLEKIAAPDLAAAQAEAARLLGPVSGLFVTGPHEHVPASSDAGN